VNGFEFPAEDSEEIASDPNRSQPFKTRSHSISFARERRQRDRIHLRSTRDPSKSGALGFESAAENPNRSALDLKVPRLHSRELASDLNRLRLIQTDSMPFKTSAGNPKEIAFAAVI
jgi:hypothetical protein